MQSTADFCAELHTFCAQNGVQWPLPKDIRLSERRCSVFFSSSPEWVVFGYLPAKDYPYQIDALRAWGAEHMDKRTALTHLLELLRVGL